MHGGYICPAYEALLSGNPSRLQASDSTRSGGRSAGVALRQRLTHDAAFDDKPRQQDRYDTPTRVSNSSKPQKIEPQMSDGWCGFHGCHTHPPYPTCVVQAFHSTVQGAAVSIGMTLPKQLTLDSKVAMKAPKTSCQQSPPADDVWHYVFGDKGSSITAPAGLSEVA